MTTPTHRRLLLLGALLAVLATGCNLRSVGANFSGQLADGTRTARTTPVAATGTTTFTQVSAGDIHTCGIAEAGTLHCWGDGAQSRLGLGSDAASKAEPTQVGTASDWLLVSAGDAHTCGIRGAQRQVFCWGSNDQGRSVPSGALASPPTPVPTLVDVEGGFVDVSAGASHSCAVHENGRLFCWGSNADGRLGVGDRDNPDVLRQVAGTWRSVSASEHTCGIRSDRTLHCWGANDHGQLGTGDLEDALAPRPVAVAGGWSSVDVGRASTCGLTAAADVLCWGEGEDGQLGNGRTLDRSVPIRIQRPGPWRDLSVGARHACALGVGAAVHCWGDNDRGKIGDGTTVDRTVPVAVAGLGDRSAVGVAAGGTHTHVVLAPEE